MVEAIACGVEGPQRLKENIGEGGEGKERTFIMSLCIYVTVFQRHRLREGTLSLS